MTTVFTLEKGLINLGAGEKRKGIYLVHCETDGEIIITWRDGTTSTYAMKEGDDRGVIDSDAVEVSSGTFSFAKA
jgi:hypothetical protein